MHFDGKKVRLVIEEPPLLFTTRNEGGLDYSCRMKDYIDTNRSNKERNKKR